MYFQIWQSKSNQNWYWHLRGANNEIITQREGYTTKENCLHAISLVMSTNAQTPVYAA